MPLLLISFLSGVLTVLAPCTLPILPIIVGGSLQGGARSKWKPFIITGSLALSIILFTLLLKASTVFIDIPQSVWAYVSGGILTVFGLIMFFPKPWEALSAKFKFSQKSNTLLAQSATEHKGIASDILIGASLGPVFSSCSPTYFVILATVLPQSFATGILYLFAYAIGLALILLLVAFLGQAFVSKLQWAANPSGWFKRGLGILFILVGIFIFTGLDKKVQTSILESGYFNITNFEQKLLESAEMDMDDMDPEKINMSTLDKAALYPKYREIVSPSGFVNTDQPVRLEDLVGKKVILLDFMTYSCINCIRTFPYLVDWYDKYKDQGLEVVGIHTPEFAFEHKIENVREAMKKYGIEFPVVLDNDYGTWRNYGNRYWPRKYLIDIDGYIVYDHIGEGGYEETEEKIQALLKERMSKLGEEGSVNMPISSIQAESVDGTKPRTPEIYFGASRNTQFDNGPSGTVGSFSAESTKTPALDRYALTGDWMISPEEATNIAGNAVITLRYQGQKVFIVAGADQDVTLRLVLDGQEVGEYRGSDVAEDGTVTINEERLYRLIEADEYGKHTLEIHIENPGLQAFTFTFG